MVTATRRLTYQDYLNTPDDERYELINGDLIVAPGPNIPHQDYQANLGGAMQVFTKQRRLGKVLFSDTDVVLSENDVVKPDLLFVSNERQDIVGIGNIRGAPDLVVEILSPSTSSRDWNEKRELYSKHGVKEYIVMDPAEKVVWRLELTDGSLEIVETYREGDTVTLSTIQGFSIAVNYIFDDVFMP